jgi:diacylglycerol O-acyltransferase
MPDNWPCWFDLRRPVFHKGTGSRVIHRLKGVDAYLWYNETPTNHMHTLKVAVLDTSGPAVPYTAERFIRSLDERLHLLPSFRWRLVETPLGLHHPVWVEDPIFDINRHVYRWTAQAPGGSKEMDEAIGRVASTPLLHDRPLWELHLIEGLANARVAAVAKIHHAMADGGAAANQLLNVAEPFPGEAVPPPIEPWNPAPLPTRRKLITFALAAHPAQARSLPRLIRKSWRGRRAANRYWRQHRALHARPWTAPRTFLNGTIDDRRRFATTSISLAAAQGLRVDTDYTLNDIVLAVVTETLRRILSDRGELPSGPLVANVPAATGQRPDRLFGNSVGLMFTGLPVHLPDRRARLDFIHRGVLAARKANELAGPELLDEWLEYVPPKPFAWFSNFYARSKLVTRRPPMMNVVVSNVRGPSTKLAIGGYPIADLFSVGPLDIGMALNITVWSYAGTLNFTALSCPRQLPDPHIVTDGLQHAFRQLHDDVMNVHGSQIQRTVEGP